MQELSEKVIEKFWANIDKTDTCWNWHGKVSSNGSPSLFIGNKKRVSARKISLIIANKNYDSSIRPTICNNILCVNPNHLISGTESRFWIKVSKLDKANGGCWSWLGKISSRGYAIFYVEKNSIQASHYSWLLHIGRPVPKSMVICHRCDHPYCVNPEHLFIGTQQDNMDDKVIKNRQAKGKDHGSVKLTEEQVLEIKKLSLVKSARSIAKQYNVSSTTINRILQRKIWKHTV